MVAASPAILAGALLAVAASAAARPPGTFRWQLQPFCNVLTVLVAQVGGVCRLEGRRPPGSTKAAG